MSYPLHANALAGYRRMLRETGQSVIFRRITGDAPNVTEQSAQVCAVFRAYVPTTPIGQAARTGEISEGLREFIVLEDDLEDAGFPLPVLKNDKIMVGSEQFNITDVDPGTRIVAGAIAGKAVGV